MTEFGCLFLFLTLQRCCLCSVDYLLHHIWQKTLEHVKNVIHNGSKHDSVDVLQMLLQTYEEIVENQVFPPEMLLVSPQIH